VRFGDGLDDRQAEADTGVVVADALGTALEWLGNRREQLRCEFSTVAATVPDARESIFERR
jgi:hypothetical protein